MIGTYIGVISIRSESFQEAVCIIHDPLCFTVVRPVCLPACLELLNRSLENALQETNDLACRSIHGAVWKLPRKKSALAALYNPEQL